VTADSSVALKCQRRRRRRRQVTFSPPAALDMATMTMIANGTSTVYDRQSTCLVHACLHLLMLCEHRLTADISLVHKSPESHVGLRIGSTHATASHPTVDVRSSDPGVVGRGRPDFEGSTRTWSES
jgi:hypothetical protein